MKKADQESLARRVKSVSASLGLAALSVTVAQFGDFEPLVTLGARISAALALVAAGGFAMAPLAKQRA